MIKEPTQHLAPTSNSHQEKRARLYAQVDGLREDLRALNRRLEASTTGYLELRARRAALEVKLDQSLCEIGALSYDADCDLEVDGQASARDGAEAEEAGAGPSEGGADLAEPAAERTRAVRLGIVDWVAKAAAQKSAAQGGEEQRGETGAATAIAAAELERSMRQNDASRPSLPAGYLAAAKLLPAIKSSLGSPCASVETYADVMSELGTLHRAAQPEQLEKWAQLADEIQRALAAYVVARLRRLQDELGGGLSGLALGDERLPEIFSRLRNHMETYWPGHVHGLARDHSPLHGSWGADAREYKETLDGFAEKYYGDGHQPAAAFNPEIALNEIEAFIGQQPEESALRAFVEERMQAGLRVDDPRLVKLLADFEDVFQGGEFSKLHAALSRDADPDAQASELAAPALPADWPWADKLRRSRVLMIGGDMRPDAQARLEAAFAPAEFHWPSIEYNKSVRIVQSWAERIRRGSVDIVILLTEFVSHKVSGAVVEAIKDAPGVELVYIDRGYGVTQVQRGIETFVSPIVHSEQAG